MIDQASHRAGDIGGFTLAANANRGGAFEREATGEDRDPPEYASFGGIEERVTPFDRRVKGAMARIVAVFVAQGSKRRCELAA